MTRYLTQLDASRTADRRPAHAVSIRVAAAPSSLRFSDTPPAFMRMRLARRGCACPAHATSGCWPSGRPRAGVLRFTPVSSSCA